MSDDSDDMDAALGNQTRASEWKGLRLALAERLKNLRDAQTQTTDPDELIRLARQLETLEAQLDTIRIEEAVADFVEKSIRYTINSNKMIDQFQDEGKE
jgi:hypothetical protein